MLSRTRTAKFALVALSIGATLSVGLAAVFAAQLQRAVTDVEIAVRPDNVHFARTFEASQFQRGNLHAHSTLSDGSSTPEQTIRWYKSHGYQFLALTDHNVLSRPERYAAFQQPGFVLIPGEEVTMTGKGRQVHVNALCTHARIAGGAFGSAAAALSSAIGQVAAQGGVAIVNHPNFDWALSSADVIGAKNAALLEIASGHPYVHSTGNVTHLSNEQLWDVALGSGAQYMGVAVDDLHRIEGPGTPAAFPGKGWVQVFGGNGNAKSICTALAQGNLYSSTGVELRRIAVTRNEYVIEPARSDVEVKYIGGGGRELARFQFRAGMRSTSYSLRGDEGYVRAQIVSPDGKRAWTPAIRVERGS